MTTVCYFTGSPQIGSRIPLNGGFLNPSPCDVGCTTDFLTYSAVTICQGRRHLGSICDSTARTAAFNGSGCRTDLRHIVFCSYRWYRFTRFPRSPAEFEVTETQNPYPSRVGLPSPRAEANASSQAAAEQCKCCNLNVRRSQKPTECILPICAVVLS